MAAVSVADVTDDPAGRDAFHAVANRAYADQLPGTAPVRASVERNLSRAPHQAGQRLFVAFEHGTPIGRVVARLSPHLRDDIGKPYGILGFFEAIQHQDAADALLQTAIAQLRDQGAERIVGPMDGDTWHRYRVNAGPFERPPFPLEPWNPPYYQELWERSGFRHLESYSSKWIDDVAVLLPNLESGVRRSESRGVRIRGLDRSRLHRELDVVHDISSEIFREALLYSPIPREEFLALYSGVERLLDPELVAFATAPDGSEVGFVFAYADPKLPAVHYKTIGVRAQWRRAAVAAALSHHVYSNAIGKGMRAGNHALMRDDNRSQALDAGHGKVFRRYVLYEWSGT
jgi:GNAT superfamily N-acetyltransferase